LDFPFLYGFLIQFPNIISKALTFYGSKVLSQEDSKFVEPILHVVKKAPFFTPNTIVLQSMKSTFLKKFPHIILTI
jgi:hypothetical protein